MDLADLRLSYTRTGLLESQVDSDPTAQFHVWFSEAAAANLIEPNAMALATSAPDGTPSVRMVLLKSFDERGFVFYTNYESRKAAELKACARASLLFYWAELQRQIRIVGEVVKTSDEESTAYFEGRPRGHRLGAWASAQSSVVLGRDELEASLEAASAQFQDQVPKPAHWGGYRVMPRTIEFWQGRPNRLHDRIEYVRSGDGWAIRRLAP